MTLGARIGPYEILSPLGAGGMGEVYRARDTKLNRDVAIKVLPDLVASDAERLARFTREAQALAALNHPNIAQIYGFEEFNGVLALVMELVEGEDLSERIRRGAIPIDEALPIAKQIAEAVETAHEQGTIHRDLKPANVKVRSDGTVKVLDFGLAKLIEPEVPGRTVTLNVTQSPTITSPAQMTGIGVLLGTAAYMSPEQARGKTVDKRADIWAFGCVLFEMVSAHRAFGGDTTTDVLAAVVKEEPTWAALPIDLPKAVGRLVRRCLEKDPRQRLQSIGDARVELDEALHGQSPDDVYSSRHARIGPLVWAPLAALVGVVAVAIPLLWPKVVEAPAYRATILPPQGVAITDSGGNVPSRRLALSPDGRYVAFTGTEHDGIVRLWVRPLDGTAHSVAGSDGATFPFWSPDSRSLAFFAEGQGNARLKKVALSGGPPTTLCEMPGPSGSGGTWNRNDIILYGSISRGPIRRVSASGGDCTEVTRLDADHRETSHIYPFFLPDGQHFLYMATTQSKTGPSVGGMFVGTLASAEQTLLIRDGVNPKYASGHLIFERDRAILAQPFDLKRMTLSREAVPLVTDLQLGGQVGFSVGAVSVSETGALAYLPGAQAGDQLLWVNRAGEPLGPLGDRGDYGDVALAPDGAHASVNLTDPARFTRDIWIYDVARNQRLRFTDDAVSATSGTWSPEGSRLMFRSGRNGLGDLYEKHTTGDAAVDEVWYADSSDKSPLSWSPQGRILYQTVGEGTGSDLWTASIQGDRKPVPFRRTRFNETLGQFSPDGRWVAYVSDESGRLEVYVAPSDGTGDKILVSQGTAPRWRRDGAELFFWVGNRLTAALVDSRKTAFAVSRISPLFERQHRENRGAWYDVSPNGQRFLVNATVEESTPITLLINWPALLNKRE